MKLFRKIFIAIITMIIVNSGFAATTISPPNLSTVPTNVFSTTQKSQIENIVHAYLLTHPEVIVEAVQTLQIKQQLEMKQRAKQAIAPLMPTLLNDPVSPVAGNPKGTVNVIEFFDYRCPHCKAMQPELSALLAHDRNVRLVYKQLPIFGAESEFAARAALAAQKQGKFIALNDALLKSMSQLTNDDVLKLAAQVGLNVAQLQKDMNNPTYTKELADNQKLAEQIGIMGTPAFVVIKKLPSGITKTDFLPGQMNEAGLAKVINELI